MSADKIIADLKLEGSRFSKVTVYNALNLFTSHNLIREVSVDPERKLYGSSSGPASSFLQC